MRVQQLQPHELLAPQSLLDEIRDFVDMIGPHAFDGHGEGVFDLVNELADWEDGFGEVVNNDPGNGGAGDD
jgi:hypothetical protein